MKHNQFHVIVDEQEETHNIFRVINGELGVFVGVTKVATLISGDWFGESSLLSPIAARARVVVETKHAEIQKVAAGQLNDVFRLRPDLAATFFQNIAFEEALRVNVALIQLSRNLDRPDISANEKTGRHVIRVVENAPLRDERTQSSFRYDADVHAVKAFVGLRVPKSAKKTPRDAIVYVFQTRVAILYQRGHTQKKTIIEFANLQKIKSTGTDVAIEYSDKTVKSVLIRFPGANVAEACVRVIETMHKPEVNSAASTKLSLSSAISMFSFLPNDDGQISLVPGQRYTVLDRLEKSF